MEALDGRSINYLAAAAADCLTRDADIQEIKRTLLFVDALRVNLSNILATKVIAEGGPILPKIKK